MFDTDSFSTESFSAGSFDFGAGLSGTSFSSSSFSTGSFSVDSFELGEGGGGPFPILSGPIPSQRERLNSGSHEINIGSYFNGADSYSIDPAIEAGWSLNASTGVLSFDTDVAGTFGPYVVTAHSISGDSDTNLFTVEVYVSRDEAGRSKRRRKYWVEIDGQSFGVDSAAEAEALLNRARQVAREHAEAQARAAKQRAQGTGELIRISIPKVSASKALQPVVRQHKADLDQIYSEASRRAQLELTKRIASDDDEDDAITVLLLH